MLKEGLDQPKRMAHLPNSFEFIVNSLPTQKCSPSGCGEGPIFSSSSWAPPFCTFLPLLFSQQVLHWLCCWPCAALLCLMLTACLS